MRNPNRNVVFDGGNSQYPAGAADAARNAVLVNTLGWTITDGGPVAAPAAPSASASIGGPAAVCAAIDGSG